MLKMCFLIVISLGNTGEGKKNIERGKEGYKEGRTNGVPTAERREGRMLWGEGKKCFYVLTNDVPPTFILWENYYELTFQKREREGSTRKVERGEEEKDNY